MNVLIFQTGEPLQIDGDNSRPMRAINLSNYLLKKGHSVHLVSTRFYHQKKIHRQPYDSEISSEFKTTLIDSPGYSRNISFARLFDHFILAINVNKFLKNLIGSKPDIIFVGYPPIESAYVFSKYCNKHEIPLVLDVKDQWPDYFLSAIPSSIHFFGRILLAPYFYLASYSFLRADLLISMSKSYLSWIKRLTYIGSDSSKHFLEAPLTRENPSISFAYYNMSLWWSKCGVDISKKNCISFVGTLSRAFDFSVVRYLAEKSLANHLDIIFVICGDGEESANVKKVMAGLSNVVFPGWIGEEKILSLMHSTILTLAPYKSQPNFSDNIPNKIIDSLSYGKPILTGLVGEVSELVSLNKVGLIWGEDLEIFYKEFDKLILNRQLLNTYSENARMLYKTRFSYDLVYSNICNAMENVVAAGKRSKD